jgi:hypothetical protein
VIRSLWIACLLLISSTVRGAELTHIMTDGRVGARVQGLDLPESLSKDLRSGLTNRLIVRVILLAGEQQQATASVAIELQYDLWDERFRVGLYADGVALDSPQLRTVDEALAWLSDVHLPRLFAIPSNLPVLKMQADVLLNPIERERMEHIRKWVKENSSYVPLQGRTRTTTPQPSSNAVFNRIFEEYASGQDVAAEWRQHIASASFTITVP